MPVVGGAPVVSQSVPAAAAVPRGKLPLVSDTLVAGLRRTAGTTPGRLGLIMVGLAALSIVAGVVGLTSIQGRANTLDDLSAHREPFSAAAQQIYRSLSDADATAASGFLSGATQPAALRERYQADIARAGRSLAVAATDLSSAPPEALDKLTVLSTQIPVYTGLVERASAGNQQGFPIGSAYLREADNLMQTTLLPASQRLYAIDRDRLAAAQNDASGFPWVATILAVALVVALVFAQRYLRRRTNRMFNLGLVVATVAVGVAVLWSAVGLIFETVSVDGGRTVGSSQVNLLADARTKALQARTDEMLTLVARGGQDYEGAFQALRKDIGGGDGSGGLLGQALAGQGDATVTSQVGDAITATRTWFAQHQTVSRDNTSGDFADAVNITLGINGAKDNEAATFDRVDGVLNSAINQARTDFANRTDTARNWLTALPIGVLVLFVLAAVGATVGIWQRLREYR